MKRQAPLRYPLPLRPGLEIVPLRPGLSHSEGTKAYLHEQDGTPVAVLREYLNETFVSGLRQLRLLEAAGVVVADYLPFIVPNKKEYLLIEYIKGKPFDRAAVRASPSRSIKLAQTIGRYTADAIRSGDEFICDIGSAYQFMLRDSTPVLVDLDMHMYDGAGSVAEQRFQAIDIYNELCDREFGLIPPRYFEQAPELLAPLYSLTTIT